MGLPGSPVDCPRLHKIWGETKGSGDVLRSPFRLRGGIFPPTPSMPSATIFLCVVPGKGMQSIRLALPEWGKTQGRVLALLFNSTGRLFHHLCSEIFGCTQRPQYLIQCPWIEWWERCPDGSPQRIHRDDREYRNQNPQAIGILSQLSRVLQFHPRFRRRSLEEQRGGGEILVNRMPAAIGSLSVGAIIDDALRGTGVAARTLRRSAGRSMDDPHIHVKGSADLHRFHSLVLSKSTTLKSGT